MEKIKFFQLIIYAFFIEFLFLILIIIYIPKVEYYTIKHFRKVNNDYSQTYHYLQNKLETSLKVNQTVLAFIIIFLILLIIRLLYILCVMLEDSFKVLIIDITIRFVFNFINWCMSLSIVAQVNKVRTNDDYKACTKEIYDGIVKVSIILTANYIFYPIEIILIDYVRGINSQNDRWYNYAGPSG